jgi:spore germination protein KC
MKTRRWLLSVLMVLTMPLLGGCWDRLEIEDRGTILGLAIDPAGPDTPSITGPYSKSNVPGYRVTAQIAIPGRIPLGPGGGSSPGETQKPVWVVSSTGKTLDGAINDLQQELADKVFLGHLRVIIVNRQLAADPGINDIQDFLRRNAEIRRLAWLVISTGDASEAMEAAPKLERVPTLYLVGTLDHAVVLGKLPNTFLGRYWSLLAAKGQEPVLPLLSVRGTDRIVIEGLAVFKGPRMVDRLDPLETAAFMEIMNERHAGYAVAVPKPGDPSGSIMYKGTNRKARVNVRGQGSNLSIDVTSRIEANIEEKTGPKPINQKIPEIEQEIRTQLTAGQQRLIAKTQRLGTDIFGFGEYVRGTRPTYWEENVQTRTRWDEMYAHIPVHCHVHLYIRRFGMSAH